MHVVVLARSTRMELLSAMNAALAARGYVIPGREPDRDVIDYAIGDAGVYVACSFSAGALVDNVLASLADRGIEARAAFAEVHGPTAVNGEVVDVSGGEVGVWHDASGEAAELAEEWLGYADPDSIEADLAFALLDVDGGLRQSEHLSMSRDPDAPVTYGKPPPPREPQPWRRFAHEDGRKWSVRLRDDGYDVEIVDVDGDVIARARSSTHARDDVMVLVADQLREGFRER